MPCDRIWLINLSFCNTSARGKDEICLSGCEIIVNFRVPSTTDTQSVDEQILIDKQKTKQHSVILYVIAFMVKLMTFALILACVSIYLLFTIRLYCKCVVPGFNYVPQKMFWNIMILLCFLFLFFF